MEGVLIKQSSTTKNPRLIYTELPNKLIKKILPNKKLLPKQTPGRLQRKRPKPDSM